MYVPARSLKLVMTDTGRSAQVRMTSTYRRRASILRAMQRITGVLAPVVTPFSRDLQPDPRRLISHCRWLLSQGAGVAVFGTTSEGNSLSVEEKIELLDKLTDGGIDAARVMPGTGSSALPDTVRLTAHATRLGCAGVLLLPPFYYKNVSDEGLFRNFAEVIERVGDARLRIYLYNIPPVSQVPITVPLIERLLKAYPGTVAGAKDSSGDWENTRSYLDNFAAQGFDVFPGSEAFLLQGLRHGGAGCISATANVNAAAIARLFAAWQAADADARQLELNQVRAIFARYPMIPALKAVLAHHTEDAAWNTVRPPLVEMTGEQTASLLDELRLARFTMAGQVRQERGG
ncbi:MAG TPA: dihydrodipicolinate synthase family protein [Gemmatimonadaceae bacterium]